MQKKDVLTIVSDKKEVEIPIRSILYVKMDGNNAFARTLPDNVYQTRMTLAELEPLLGDDFIKVKRGCLVSVIAIHDITDWVVLSNGEKLDYARRKRKEIIREFHEKQQRIIRGFNEEVSPVENNDYGEYYKVFDSMPFAFADIEMVFDDEFKAVDWIFRYGNEALAELEKTPLKKIIGSSFSSIFPNMDAKWLGSYERAALFGETLKIIDYSPEIDAYLDIICFPTFKGHCGCILFDISKIKSFRQPTDTEKALSVFISRLTNL